METRDHENQWRPQKKKKKKKHKRLQRYVKHENEKKANGKIPTQKIQKQQISNIKLM